MNTAQLIKLLLTERDTVEAVRTLGNAQLCAVMAALGTDVDETSTEGLLLALCLVESSRRWVANIERPTGNLELRREEKEDLV